MKITQFGEMRKTPAFGIDLGTTNSCIAVIGNGSKPEIIKLKDKITLPSCVMWKGGNDFVVGNEVYEKRGDSNVIYSVKRLMGSNQKIKLTYNGVSRQFEPWEISSEILKALVSTARVGIYKDIKEVIITVPAYFTNTQIEETQHAGKAAGLNILGIMKEPTAAALLYNQETDIKRSKLILIYDLGGGTFDVSVVMISEQQDSELDELYGLTTGESKSLFSVLKVLGDMKLGGDDIDSILADKCINRLLSNEIHRGNISKQDRERIILRVEKLKKKGIASYRGKIKINGKEADFRLEPEDFIDAFGKIYEKTKILVDRILADSVVGGAIDQIITVGGSTKSQIIQERLKHDFPQIPVNASMNPDESVALGAAIQAKRIKFGDDSINILDCLAMNIGVLSEGYVNAILKSGEQIPCFNYKTFLTVEEGQSQIELEVYQGLTRFPEECTLLGKLYIDNIDIQKGKFGRVFVTLSVNSNGLLEIEAEIGNNLPKRMSLVNISGASQDILEDKRVVRWKHFANSLDMDKQKTLLNLINQFREGVIQENIITDFITENKKSVGSYNTNIYIGRLEMGEN